MLPVANLPLSFSLKSVVLRIQRLAIALCLLVVLAIGIECPSSAWAATNLGLSPEQVQTSLEPLGLHFKPASETVVMAKSRDGVATVRLDVRAEAIAGATLKVQKPFKQKRQAQSLNYMSEFLQVMLPEWQDAQVWIEKGISEAKEFGSTDLVVGDRRIFLIIPRSQEALLLAVDPVNPN